VSSAAARAALPWAALIVLAGVLTYWNGLRAGFVYDDTASVLENTTIRSLSPFWAPLGAPTRSAPTAGRPVVNVTFAVNYALGGVNPLGYHLWNLATHVLCALVLFGVVRRTLLNARGRIVPEGSTPAVAFVCALLWMVHPLQSEAVDYVSARTESTMALGYLLTFYCAVRALEPGARVAWTAAAAIACAAGMASKETMLTAPLLLGVYDRVFAFPSLGQAFRRRWLLYCGVCAAAVIGVALIANAPRGGSAGLSANPGLVARITPWGYLLNQSVMITHYLRLLIWPFGMVIDYGVPRPMTFGAAWPYVVAVGSLALATVVSLARWSAVGFLGAWFFVTLAPASSIVPVFTEVGAERRMYLPAAAVVVLGVVAAWRWSVRAGASRALQASVVAVAALFLAAASVARNSEYLSPLTLWQTAVDRWPHGRARYHLGLELKRAGRRDAMYRELNEAVGDFPEAHYGLGVELFEDGRYDAAVRELEAFVEARPLQLNVVDARELIGRALAASGRPDAAIEQFRTILRMVPGHANAHGRIADVMFSQQRFAEAAEEYRQFLAVRGEQVGSWTNYGISLSAAGRDEEAIEAFQRAAALDPRSAAAHRNLANALLPRGDYAAAAAHAREAVRLSPRDAVAHDLLGLALLGQQHAAEAAAEFRAALAIDPTYPDARAHLHSTSR